jgi:hypothetical protein
MLGFPKIASLIEGTFFFFPIIEPWSQGIFKTTQKPELRQVSNCQMLAPSSSSFSS